MNTPTRTTPAFVIVSSASACASGANADSATPAKASEANAWLKRRRRRAAVVMGASFLNVETVVKATLGMQKTGNNRNLRMEAMRSAHAVRVLPATITHEPNAWRRGAGNFGS